MTTNTEMSLRGSPIAILVTVIIAASIPLGARFALVKDVPLSGRAARFDYQTLDTAKNRLYIAHMRSDQLVVFDTKAEKEIATIDDMPGATGVLAVPELHRVYVSVTGHRHVAVIDDRSLKVLATLGEIGFPDGIAYAPLQQKIFVSDEKQGNELIINAANDRVIGGVNVGGEAGNSKYDPLSKHILVAVQTRNDIAEIDPATNLVVGRFTFRGADEPHGMLVDDDDGLLFVANQGSGMMTVLNLKTRAWIAEYRVGDDPDVLAFDVRRRLLYVAAEAGVVAAFEIRGKSVKASGVMRFPHAHTVAADSRTGRVYLPLENVAGHPMLRIMLPRCSRCRDN